MGKGSESVSEPVWIQYRFQVRYELMTGSRTNMESVSTPGPVWAHDLFQALYPPVSMPIASSELIEILPKLYGVEGAMGSMDGVSITCGNPVALFRKVREVKNVNVNTRYDYFIGLRTGMGLVMVLVIIMGCYQFLI